MVYVHENDKEPNSNVHSTSSGSILQNCKRRKRIHAGNYTSTESNSEIEKAPRFLLRDEPRFEPSQLICPQMSLQVFVNDGGLRRQTALRETATSSIPSTTLRPQSPGTDSATFRHSALSKRASFILPSIDEQRNAHHDCASSGQRNLAHEGDEGSISNNGDSSSDRPTRMAAVGLLPTMDVVSDNSSEDLDFGSQNSNSSGGSINNCSSTIQSDFDLFLDNDDIFSTRDNTVTNANIAASKLSWRFIHFIEKRDPAVICCAML